MNVYLNIEKLLCRSRVTLIIRVVFYMIQWGYLVINQGYLEYIAQQDYFLHGLCSNINSYILISSRRAFRG